MNTVGQPPEAVDAIMEASDPKYLFLELDVAHYLQGGGDPAAAIRKYGRRILFMHFKDVIKADNKSGYEWVELGKGRVDFPAIFVALHEVHFRGWVSSSWIACPPAILFRLKTPTPPVCAFCARNSGCKHELSFPSRRYQ